MPIERWILHTQNSLIINAFNTKDVKAFYGAAATCVAAVTDLFQSLIFTFHLAATQSSISALLLFYLYEF